MKHDEHKNSHVDRNNLSKLYLMAIFRMKLDLYQIKLTFGNRLNTLSVGKGNHLKDEKLS